jgi:hypothetical protein
VRGRVDLFGGGSIRRLFCLSIGVVRSLSWWFWGGGLVRMVSGFLVFWCSGVLVLIVVRLGEGTEGGEGRVAGWVMEQEDSRGDSKGVESHDLETESEFEMHDDRDINEDGEGADIDVENVKEHEVDSLSLAEGFQL